tara:strand:+ start:2599 stop:2778 length:180 start_codon:yes stop_codon:yes gene_type:complete
MRHTGAGGKNSDESRGDDVSNQAVLSHLACNVRMSLRKKIQVLTANFKDATLEMHGADR